MYLRNNAIAVTFPGLPDAGRVEASSQLNRQQLIGLAHYDEFLERMPREEAGEIEQTVQYQRALISHPYGCVNVAPYSTYSSW